MFSTKERILGALIGLGALALGFFMAFLPFWAWYTFGWSLEFLAAASVAALFTVMLATGI